MNSRLLEQCNFTTTGGRVRFQIVCLAMLCLLLTSSTGNALEGDLRVHDPSTVVACEGKYYVFSTGPGIPILSSDDGFTWTRSGHVFDKVPDSVHSVVPKNDGRLVWAPDVIRLNGAYYLYYSISSWGSNVSAVGLLTNPTLNDKDPNYKWTDRGLVVNSVAGENLNAIDPGVMQAPDGTLWLTYGSYIGNVQLVQLNPKTGLRISRDSPTHILSSASEASDMTYNDGYYYLFVNRGSCCKGADSTYNIRMGRARKPTGPFLDRYGLDMAHGGGSLFLASQNGHIGPGHFGRVIMDGVEKVSIHYEGAVASDGSRGRGGLAILPLLWSADGWPAAGEDLKDGTYQVQSKRLGTDLEVAPADPAGQSKLRMGSYSELPNQMWEFARAGGGYYKILESGGTNALEAVEPVNGGAAIGTLAVTNYTAATNQLWKVDQVTDRGFRISAKQKGLVLTALPADASTYQVVLQPYGQDDTQQWFVAMP
jgi:beta-xylosidase